MRNPETQKSFEKAQMAWTLSGLRAGRDRTLTNVFGRPRSAE